MTYLEFFSQYSCKYEIKAYKIHRVHGTKLYNTKIVIYLLRIKFFLGFNTISDMLLLSRQLAAIYYYDTLRNEDMRKEANTRWEGIVSARDISTTLGSKEDSD